MTARVALKVEAAQRGPGGVPVHDLSPDSAPAAPSDPELAFLRTHFADDFRAAVEGAIAALSVPEANILRMHFIDGHTQDEIARVLRVSSRTIRRRLVEVREKVTQGTALAETLAGHPKIFPELYVNMVRSGEAAGNLDAVLLRLADFMDAQNALRAIEPLVEAGVLAEFTGFTRNRMWQATAVLDALDAFDARAGRRISL